MNWRRQCCYKYHITYVHRMVIMPVLAVYTRHMYRKRDDVDDLGQMWRDVLVQSSRHRAQHCALHLGRQVLLRVEHCDMGRVMCCDVM